MARQARLTVPGLPHHVTQRGNRRQPVFFSDADRRLYLRILKEEGDRFGVQYWAYCLMDNHVHLIAVPKNETSLAKGIGEAHRRYTRLVNLREDWVGYLWQGRFASFPLQEKYLTAAMRYVELNPVRAGIVARADEYVWSSARAHVHKREDPLLVKHFLEGEIQDWADFLGESGESKESDLSEEFQQRRRTGWPLGDDPFMTDLERQVGRNLRKGKAGRPGKVSEIA